MIRTLKDLTLKVMNSTKTICIIFNYIQYKQFTLYYMEHHNWGDNVVVFTYCLN